MYSIEQIRSIVKGRWLQQGNDAAIEHLLLDSRKLLFPASTLFFALHSARRNGHSFIAELHEKGVYNFIVSKEEGIEWPAGANIIVVNNTLQALQALAAQHRKQFHFPVIGITGSNGKTIVKEWLNQLLEENMPLYAAPKVITHRLACRSVFGK